MNISVGGANRNVNFLLTVVLKGPISDDFFSVVYLTSVGLKWGCGPQMVNMDLMHCCCDVQDTTTRPDIAEC